MVPRQPQTSRQSSMLNSVRGQLIPAAHPLIDSDIDRQHSDRLSKHCQHLSLFSRLIIMHHPDPDSDSHLSTSSSPSNVIQKPMRPPTYSRSLLWTHGLNTKYTMPMPSTLQANAITLCITLHFTFPPPGTFSSLIRPRQLTERPDISPSHVHPHRNSVSLPSSSRGTGYQRVAHHDAPARRNMPNPLSCRSDLHHGFIKF